MNKIKLQEELKAVGCMFVNNRYSDELDIFVGDKADSEKAIAWVDEESVSLFGFYAITGSRIEASKRKAVAKILVEYAETEIEKRKINEYTVTISLTSTKLKIAQSGFEAKNLVFDEIEKLLPHSLRPYLRVTAELKQ